MNPVCHDVDAPGIRGMRITALAPIIGLVAAGLSLGGKFSSTTLNCRRKTSSRRFSMPDGAVKNGKWNLPGA